MSARFARCSSLIARRSLAAAVIEVATRNFFFNIFLKDGIQNAFWVDVDKRRYATRAKLRVQDDSNDMVVKNLSIIVSSLFLFYLETIGLFKFASEEGVSESTIFVLAMYQLGPEIFLDVYATFTKIFGGLRVVHENYWSFSVGANMDSRFTVDRIGDFWKATSARRS